MTQAPDRKPKKQDNKILCCYRNASKKIKILGINKNYNSPWKRVVFPGEILFFEGIVNAELEIKQSSEKGEVIVEKMLCDRFQVKEAS
jgi:hypothetical protein